MVVKSSNRVTFGLPPEQEPQKMRLMAKIQIAASLAAVLLFFGGLNSVLHPGKKVIVHPPSPGADVLNEAGTIQVISSTASRLFGAVRMCIGAAIGVWVARTMAPGSYRLTRAPTTVGNNNQQ